MRLPIILTMITMLLVACSGKDENPTPQPEPTVTSANLSGYAGPLIGSISQPSESSQEGCTEDSGCLNIITNPVDLDDAPLSLTMQTVGDFEIGIPEGYSPLEAGNQIIITAVSTETIGGYVFSIRSIASEDDLNQLLARFDNPDFSEGTAVSGDTWQGKWLPNKQYGAIALLDISNGDQVFIESFADQPYWRAFLATYQAMLESLIIHRS